MLQVLQLGGSFPLQDVARSVCRLVGMSAATAPAVARVVLAIRGLRDTLRIIEADGNIRLPQVNHSKKRYSGKVRKGTASV